MNAYDHTLTWIKGELLEASWVLLFAAVTLLLAASFWKWGHTAGARALVLPFVLVGLVYCGVGSSLKISNNARLKEYPARYEANPVQFAKAEKERIESFQYQYKISKTVATVCFALTLLIFWFVKNPVWQGAGIGLSYFGLAGLVVDYFSEERARIYYQAILAALKSAS